MVIVFDGPAVVFWLMLFFVGVIFVGSGVVLAHLYLIRRLRVIVQRWAVLEKVCNEQMFHDIHSFLRGEK